MERLQNKDFLLMLTAVLVFSMAASASIPETPVEERTPSELEPGFIGPGSSFYWLDIGVDRVAVALGFSSPATVMEERTVEAYLMAEEDMYFEALKAVKALEHPADRSSENARLQTIASVEEIIEDAPAIAKPDFRAALDQIRSPETDSSSPGNTEIGRNYSENQVMIDENRFYSDSSNLEFVVREKLIVVNQGDESYTVSVPGMGTERTIAPGESARIEMTDGGDYKLVSEQFSHSLELDINQK